MNMWSCCCHLSLEGVVENDILSYWNCAFQHSYTWSLGVINKNVCSSFLDIHVLRMWTLEALYVLSSLLCLWQFVWIVLKLNHFGMIFSYVYIIFGIYVGCAPLFVLGSLDICGDDRCSWWVQICILSCENVARVRFFGPKANLSVLSCSWA